MITRLCSRVGRDVALVSALCLGLCAFPAAQQQTPDTHVGAAAAAVEYPSLHLAGFGNVDFADQDKSEGPRGFNEGQFVLHLVSSLSPQVNVFGELSFTPRADAGTG